MLSFLTLLLFLIIIALVIYMIWRVSEFFKNPLKGWTWY